MKSPLLHTSIYPLLAFSQDLQLEVSESGVRVLQPDGDVQELRETLNRVLEASLQWHLEQA